MVKYKHRNYVKYERRKIMGLLKDIVASIKGEEVEDPKLLEKFEKAGKDDADKIAKKMGQDRTSFVKHVDVSVPVEMPAKEPEKDDGSR